MSTRITRIAIAIAVVLITSACLDDSITGTRPLSFDLTASVTTAAVGQSITFQFTATGTAITQVTLDFDDGDADELNYQGPIEVADQTAHAYQAAGTYVVVGELIAQQGTARDSVTITVN